MTIDHDSLQDLKDSFRYGTGADEDPGDLMEGLVFDPTAPIPKDVPVLGPDEEVMVVVSLKLPPATLLALKTLADQRGEKYTVMLRGWIEAELAAAAAGGAVTRDEALRAVEVLRKLGHVTDAA